jgi:hypothetical protein
MGTWGLEDESVDALFGLHSGPRQRQRHIIPIRKPVCIPKNSDTDVVVANRVRKKQSSAIIAVDV